MFNMVPANLVGAPCQTCHRPLEHVGPSKKNGRLDIIGCHWCNTVYEPDKTGTVKSPSGTYKLMFGDKFSDHSPATPATA